MVIKDLYGYYFAINTDFKKRMFEKWVIEKKTAYKLLLQLLTFIELSEIEEITIKPNSQHGFGSKKDPKTLYNANKFPITLVNSRWATKVYRPGEFWVGSETGGFWRVQPCGPGRSQYELKWTNPFKKNGITISAKKEKQS